MKGLRAGTCSGCGAEKLFFGRSIRCSTCGAVVKPEKRPKYGNKPVTVGGEWFQSEKEARRWKELLLLQSAGHISGLRRQVPFALHAPGGQQVATYNSDFTYQEGGELVVEDVKSPPTRKKETYRTKRRWMKAEYQIEIREV